MNAWRSSAVNSVFSLRTGLLTTPTTTRSKTLGAAGDDVDVAVGDRVVAARADDGAVALALISRPPRRRRRRRRRSGAGAGARSESMRSGRRAPLSTIARPPLGEEARQMGVEVLPHAVGESIGGVDEDEVEAWPLRVLAGPASQRATSARTSSTRSPRPRRSTLPSAGAGVAVDQGGARRRRARAPRSRGRRCRSRGRGRGAPSTRRRARRRSPRGRGRRSAAPSSPAARPGAGPSALRRSRASADAFIRLMQRDRVGGAGAEAAAGGVEQRAELGGVERAVARAAARAPRRGRRSATAPSSGSSATAKRGRPSGGCRAPRPRRAG